MQAVQAPFTDDPVTEEDEVDSDFELDLDAMLAVADGHALLQAPSSLHRVYTSTYGSDAQDLTWSFMCTHFRSLPVLLFSHCTL